MQQYHCPVLLAPAIGGLAIKPEGNYVDATFGRGGHAQAILGQLGDNGRLLAIDRDPDAIAFAGKQFAGESRLQCRQDSFANLAAIVEAEGMLGRIDGVLLDLGVSSPQLDQAERGFSFLRDGPLDMRMDLNQTLTAATWLSSAKEADIVWALVHYGEERFAKRIARAIINARAQTPITTTGQLAEIVAKANPRWERDKHPATRSFQALRILVNDEMRALEQMLSQVLEVLHAGGRLVVISFHSLEDRIVKRFMRDNARGDYYPAKLAVTVAQLQPKLRCIGKAIRAEGEEIKQNPRARSATLRVAEKLA